MARLSAVTREQLDPEDHQYFDSIVGSRGSIRGPYGVLMHSPKLAARVADTGAFVRFDFGIPESLKEIVIIATAKEMESQYEFSAHAKLARTAGVSDETIKAIATGTAPAGLSGDEALLVGYVHELLQDHKVTEATYKMPVSASTAPPCQFAPPVMCGSINIALAPSAPARIGGVKRGPSWYSDAILRASAFSSAVKSRRSSVVTPCRSKGTGLVGNGCVGDVRSPGTVDWGTGRSSIGHTGSPVTRSKT